MTEKPHIVLLQADQLQTGAIGAYGCEAAHTPTMNSIAARGTVFTNAYCTFPVCAPSRFSMATGRLASRSGVYDNASEMPASAPTYAHYLRAAGYATCLAGKMHFVGPDQLHGFEERLMPELYPTDFSWVANWADEGERDTNDPRGVTISGPCVRTPQLDYDDEATFRAVRRIHDFAGGRNPRPLFLQLSLTHPHDPFLCRQEYWDLFEGVDIPLPTVPPRTPEEHDPYSRRLLEQFGLLHAEFSEEEIRRARRAYYGSVAYVDAMFGRVMRALQETGLEEKTVVILTSDHGEMLGERGMWFKKTFFEPSIKVPLMISLPGGAGASGNEISVNVSLIDLLPTLAELGGSEVQPLEHEGFDGRSLVPLLEPSAGGAGRTEQLPGAVETFADRPVFAEYLGENAGAPVLMAKKGDYKYIYNRTDPEQLYDLATDPNETANLLAPEGTRPGAAPEEVRAELRSILDATWDEAALDRDVRLSQRRRMLIRDALKNGKPPDWTTDRSEDDSNRWYRGKQGYNEWAFDYL